MVDMGVLVGTIRRFGLAGPAYEIAGGAEPTPDGEPQMTIVSFESGERLAYPVAAILADPAED